MNVGGALFRFMQPITVNRATGGAWSAGVWTQGATPIQMQAVVTVPDPTDLEMIPEGDRSTGAIAVFVAPPDQLYLTTSAGTADTITWNGQNWRVMRVTDNTMYGYVQALCVKMDPTTEP